MVNVREIAKAFIDGKPYFDGKYLVYVTSIDYSHLKCYVKAISDHVTELEEDYVGYKTFIHIFMCKDSYNEIVDMFINRAHDVNIGAEIINELSDYIYTLTSIKISAFTVEEDYALYIAIKGFEYPFREYKRKTTMVRRGRDGQHVKIYGYYNRFALFRDCRQCVEYANRIAELRNMIEKLYNEFLEWYYMLDFEDLEKILGSPVHRKVREIKYEVNRLVNRDIVIGTGMYIGRRSPRQVLRAYERIAEKLEEIISKARELHILRTLIS